MKTSLFSLMLFAVLSSSSLNTYADSAKYSVTDGNKLDKDTYRGFIVHRNMCARCHGNFGQGMIGPNLADSMQTLTRNEFEDIVANGRMAMPPWKTNDQVMGTLDELFAYYSARADGAIGEVRPAKAE